MTQQTRERIESICKNQWEIRGIDPTAVAEMLDELRTHLDDARADGETPTAVVGDDVHAFAASWASARQPRARRWGRLTLDFASVLVLILAYFHLRHWSTETSVPLGVAIAIGAVAPVVAFAELRRGPLGFWALQVPVALILAAGLALDHFIFHGAVLLTVPLWFTSPLALLAVGRFVRDYRRRSSTQQVPSRA